MKSEIGALVGGGSVWLRECVLGFLLVFIGLCGPLFENFLEDDAFFAAFGQKNLTVPKDEVSFPRI